MFNLLNKIRFLKKDISDIASDFASRSYNMRMFNHAVIITNDSISYFANFLYCWEVCPKLVQNFIKS
ncbi:unnamed protein product [Rhizophagus irregularis]|nr:unnamed protein product [Rhizophagus irregularis]